MGVTLERVQNKFACIIGELCSEPVILSQFAIWVDLRIAEYKAKGAISLDCSGEDPEPGWLNGHRLHRKNESRERMLGRTPVRKSLSRPLGHPPSMHSSPVSRYDQSPAGSQVDSDQGFLGETRLSPNLMVIKDEPTDGTPGSGVYPTGIHAHGAVTPTRKRPASETLSQADSNFYEQQNTSTHSPSKVQRLSSTGDSPHQGDTTSNQSLMSIISGEIEEGNQTAGNLNERDIDIILDYESKNTFPPQREDNSVSAASRLPEASSSSTADVSDSFSQESSSNTAGEIGHSSRTADRCGTSGAQEGGHLSEENSVMRAICDTDLLAQIKHAIRARLFDGTEEPPTSARHLVAAASTLECWLLTAKGDHRKLETIPPVELDPYLVEFFSLLKRRDGRDYDPDGFGNFRSSIDHYLARRHYPASIRRSEAFRSSQLVFKIKRKGLSEIERVKQIEKLHAEENMNVDFNA